MSNIKWLLEEFKAAEGEAVADMDEVQYFVDWVQKRALPIIEPLLDEERVFKIAEELGCEIPSGPEGKEYYFSPTELLAFVAAQRDQLYSTALELATLSTAHNQLEAGDVEGALKILRYRIGKITLGKVRS